VKFATSFSQYLQKVNFEAKLFMLAATLLSEQLKFRCLVPFNFNITFSGHSIFIFVLAADLRGSGKLKAALE
jgi:hypothetical protein